MGFETEHSVVRMHKKLRLHMCGEIVDAKTDVCILDANSKILLIKRIRRTLYLLILRLS